MKIFSLAVLASFFVTVSGSFGVQNKPWIKQRGAEAPLPKEAEEVLDKIPGRSLSPLFVVQAAMKHSSSFKRVLAIAPVSEIAINGILAPLDTRLYANLSAGSDKRQTLGPMNPTESSQYGANLGVMIPFRTGTSLNFELGHGKASYTFPTGSLEGFDTRGTLSLKQDLWKNFLGTGTRKSLEAGELSREAALLELEYSIEDWSQGMVEVYFNAWLTQQRAFAATENRQRAESLAEIVKIRNRRGTSEKQNLIQIQSKVAVSQSFESSAHQALGTQWKGLVVSLGFPETFLSIDPLRVPMNSQAPTQEAFETCRVTDLKSVSEIGKKNSKVRSFEAKGKVGELKHTKATLLFGPDIQLSASYSGNALSQTSRNESLREGLKLENPAWNVLVSASIPFGMSAEKSELAAAMVEKISSQALAVQAVDTFVVEWLSECENLSRLQDIENKLSQSYSTQQERILLEERRFEIGRGSLFDVIQAGDEATQIRVELRTTQAQLGVTAWKIKKLSGKLLQYLGVDSNNIKQLSRAIVE